MNKIGKIALSVVVASFFVACGGGSDNISTDKFEINEAKIVNQKINFGNDFIVFKKENNKKVFSMNHLNMPMNGTWNISGENEVTLVFDKPMGKMAEIKAVFDDKNNNKKIDSGDTITSHMGSDLVKADITSVEKVSSNTSTEQSQKFVLTSNMVSGKKITAGEMIIDINEDSNFKIKHGEKDIVGTWSIKDDALVLTTDSNDMSIAFADANSNNMIDAGDKVGHGDKATIIEKVEGIKKGGQVEEPKKNDKFKLIDSILAGKTLKLVDDSGKSKDVVFNQNKTGTIFMMGKVTDMKWEIDADKNIINLKEVDTSFGKYDALLKLEGTLDKGQKVVLEVPAMKEQGIFNFAVDSLQ